MVFENLSILSNVIIICFVQYVIILIKYGAFLVLNSSVCYLYWAQGQIHIFSWNY